ncbi:hypothetical protein KM043_001202 [Ampulex compressa]|nr:hypothetical protein KM043_001202 [Ampulex compressa]
MATKPVPTPGRAVNPRKSIGEETMPEDYEGVSRGLSQFQGVRPELLASPGLARGKSRCLLLGQSWESSLMLEVLKIFLKALFRD